MDRNEINSQFEKFNGIRNAKSLLADQGSYSIDEQRDDCPPFYTEYNRGLSSDKDLLKDAEREAKKFRRQLQKSQQDTENQDWDGNPVMSKTKALIYDNAVKLVKARNGTPKGVVTSLQDEMNALVTFMLNDMDEKGYFSNGKKDPAKFKEISDTMVDAVGKEIHNELMELAETNLESEVAATYINDDPSKIETDYFISEPKPSWHSPVDFNWSRKVTSYVIETMDPYRTGIATHPMQFRGKYFGSEYYFRKNRPLPIRHKSARQSLVWLMGPKGKLGFFSHPGLTKDDREILQNFCSASWTHYKR